MNKKKIEVAKNRTLDINPNCQIQIYDTFVSEDTIDNFDFEKFDYIIDAIDTISAKILLIEKAEILQYSNYFINGNRKQVRS